MTRVSIIMPAYNAQEYIAVAIESVLAQTFPDLELIIVDDESTDETFSICERFSCIDPRIKLVRICHGGVSIARNVGLNLAKGEFTTFLDADDVLPPRSLEARVCHLDSHPDCDVVDGYISVRTNDLSNETHRYIPYYKGTLLKRLVRLDNRVFFNVCYMLRSSIIGSVRFVERMTHGEDFLFFIHICIHRNVKYDFVESDIYWYRQSKTSAMSNLEGLENGYLMLIRQITGLVSISIADRLFFRFKVSKIMVLTWLRRGGVGRSLKSAWVLLSGR